MERVSRQNAGLAMDSLSDSDRSNSGEYSGIFFFSGVSDPVCNENYFTSACDVTGSFTCEVIFVEKSYFWEMLGAMKSMLFRPRIDLAAPLDSAGLSIYSTYLYQLLNIPVF